MKRETRPRRTFARFNFGNTHLRPDNEAPNHESPCSTTDPLISPTMVSRADTIPLASTHVVTLAPPGCEIFLACTKTPVALNGSHTHHKGSLVRGIHFNIRYVQSEGQSSLTTSLLTKEVHPLRSSNRNRELPVRFRDLKGPLSRVSLERVCVRK